ncbi:MAG: leucine-rich repeat domain-containing protein, partial [Erysipelotrichaceae bacterium]|nr:leucine-rich repeat domain-containing protein [Erysipelotrichaceae bacterium]
DIELNSAPFISEEAFYGFKNIKSVKIGGNVKEIRHRAFYNCTKLENIIIDVPGIRIYSEAFDCWKGGNIQLISDVRLIGYCAFRCFTGKTKVYIEGNVDTVSLDAFSNSNITDIRCNKDVFRKIVRSGTTTSSEIGFRFLTGKLRLSDEQAEVIKEYNGRHIIGLNTLAKNHSFELQGKPKIIERRENVRSNGFVFSIINNQAVVTSYDEDEQDVVIPDEVQGYPVTELGFGVFWHKSMKTVHIPASVHFIDGRCFGYCTSLEYVEIPDRVEELKFECFVNCSSLKEVKLSKNLFYLDANAFRSCRSLHALELPDSLLYLDGYMSNGLQRLDLPSKLIHCGASFPDSITNLVFPASLVELNANSLPLYLKTVSISRNTYLPYPDLLYRCEELEEMKCSKEQFDFLYDGLPDKSKFNLITNLIRDNRKPESNQIEFIVKHREEFIDKAVNDDDFNILISVFEYTDSKDLSTIIEKANSKKKTSLVAALVNYSEGKDKASVPGELELETVEMDVRELFSYSKTGKTVKIGKYKGSDSYLYIPKQIMGLDVVEISARAYKGANITYVSVPDTILRIGRDAFRDNPIERVEIENLKKWNNIIFETEDSNPIGINSLVECKGKIVEKVILDMDGESISPYAYNRCKTINKVEVIANKTSIGERSFANCMNLGTLVMTSDVKAIGKGAFDNCPLSQLDVTVRSMKKLIASFNTTPRLDFILTYLSGKVNVNTAAEVTLKDYIRDREKSIVRHIMKGDDSVLLKKYIDEYGISPDNIGAYIETAQFFQNNKCLTVLETLK